MGGAIYKDPVNEDDGYEAEASPKGRLNKRDAQQVHEIYRIIKGYRLSVGELHLLRKELDGAVRYARKKDQEFNRQQDTRLKNERNLLEVQLKEIEERIRLRYQPTLNETQMLLDRARENRSKISLLSSLFSNSRGDFDVRIVALEAAMHDIYCAEREELYREQSAVRSSIAGIKSKKYEGTWWEEIDVVVIRKMRVVRGERRILANEGVLFSPRDLVDLAIDRLIKKRQEEEDFRDIKARAALSDIETRKLAESVKKRIAYQIRLLGVCPYCGQALDSKVAHADHIYPVSKGGRSHAKNMVYVCSTCNIQKSDATLNQFIRFTGYDRVAIEERLFQLGKDY
jgi:hypothetical protein